MFLPGDMIIHTLDNEIGVLIDKYDVLDRPDYPLWAWNIWWMGTEAQTPRQCHAYTEEGLFILIDEGLFVHYKNS